MLNKGFKEKQQRWVTNSKQKEGEKSHLVSLECKQCLSAVLSFAKEIGFYALATKSFWPRIARN